MATGTGDQNMQRVKPRIILAASGSVAAIKFAVLARSLSDWAEVTAVVTKAALHFIDRSALPPTVKLYTDEEEWSTWSSVGDDVLHIELRRWGDALVIAPLSANTLAKVAGGLCDNLLTCIVRAWDFSKPMLVAPAMNTFMWDSPFTKKHLDAIEGLGVNIIHPISKRLACGDVGNGAMAEPSSIESIEAGVATVERAHSRSDSALTRSGSSRSLPSNCPSSSSSSVKGAAPAEKVVWDLVVKHDESENCHDSGGLSSDFSRTVGRKDKLSSLG